MPPGPLSTWGAVVEGGVVAAGIGLEIFSRWASAAAVPADRSLAKARQRLRALPQAAIDRQVATLFLTLEVFQT